VRLLYLILTVVWVGLIFLLEIYSTEPIQWLLLAIPFVAFSLGIVNIPVITSTMETEWWQDTYLSSGLVAMLPLLMWVSDQYHIPDAKYVRLMVVAMILVILSLIDWWVPTSYISLVRHLKAGLQTMALVLVMVALYEYYLVHPTLTARSPSTDVRGRQTVT
jgi:hypothetical protein